jgi:hypothetical protein
VSIIDEVDDLTNGLLTNILITLDGIDDHLNVSRCAILPIVRLECLVGNSCCIGEMLDVVIFISGNFVTRTHEMQSH